MFNVQGSMDIQSHLQVRDNPQLEPPLNEKGVPDYDASSEDWRDMTSVRMATEEADFITTSNSRNLIILPDVEHFTTGQQIEFLAKRTPVNEYGLPIYYIRSDLYLSSSAAYTGTLDEEDFASLTEFINYSEGYPTTPRGAPYWSQLVHEPLEAFSLFQNYLSLNEIEGIRLYESLARSECKELDYILELSRVYFWSTRTKAYDLFIVAAEAKKREALTRKTEGAHFDMASTLMRAIQDRLQSEPDLISQMPAKDLFDLMEQLVKIQRLSLGLTGQNASTTNKDISLPGQSVELAFRNLTKNVGLNNQTSSSIQDRLSVLMSDEATAMQVQELVVRINNGN